MREIYSSAIETIVWLGPSKVDLDSLIWATSDFVSVIKDLDWFTDLNIINNFTDPKFWKDLGTEDPLPKLISMTSFLATSR